jgi:hypothetical protein
MLYQALLGAWPLAGPDASFVDAWSPCQQGRARGQAADQLAGAQRSYEPGSTGAVSLLDRRAAAVHRQLRRLRTVAHCWAR